MSDKQRNSFQAGRERKPVETKGKSGFQAARRKPKTKPAKAKS